MAGAQARPKGPSLLERRRRSLKSAPARLDWPSVPVKEVQPPDEEAKVPQRRKGSDPLYLNCSQVVAEAACRDDPFSMSGYLRLHEQYDLLEALGQGAMGVVYSARQKADSRDVAVKVMRMHDEEVLAAAQLEFDLLSSVQHPHIIKALGFFTFSLGAALVMELFSGTSLEEAVKGSPAGRFHEDTARALFRQLVEAICHLHQHRIIHRDVKPANVLVSGALDDLRLVDFGTAHRCSQQGGLVSVAGTRDYLAPEALVEGCMTEGCDIWGAGLCLHLMLQGRLPLERNAFASDEDFGRAAITGGCGAALRAAGHITCACAESLRRSLEVDPERRATAAELLSLDWLTSKPQSLA